MRLISTKHTLPGLPLHVAYKDFLLLLWQMHQLLLISKIYFFTGPTGRIYANFKTDMLQTKFHFTKPVSPAVKSSFDHLWMFNILKFKLTQSCIMSLV